MSLKADRQWNVRSQLYLPSSDGSPGIELVFSCAEVYVYKSFTNNFQIVIVRHRKWKSEEFFSLYRRLQKGSSINRCKTQDIIGFHCASKHTSNLPIRANDSRLV